LSDFVIKVDYTSREGGPELAKMKNSLVGDKLPDTSSGTLGTRGTCSADGIGIAMTIIMVRKRKTDA
jgi:hypothetical protein